MLAIFAIFLTLAMVASVTAYTPQSRRNATVFLSTDPKTIQLGSYILVNAWTSPQPPLIPGGGMAGQIRTGYMYTITKPDGSVMTRGPLNATGEGGSWFVFTPDQLGTWTISMAWPGDEYYFPCQSPDVTFTVQSEAVSGWPAAAMPTGYWTSPVNSENREWYTLNGPWLQSAYNASYASFDCGGGFNPYTTAPESSHVLWRTQISLTGIIGGTYGTVSSGAGSASPPVVMFGNVYYNVPDGFVCVDLRTGVQKWKVVNGSVTAGQVTSGGTPYIWEFGANVVGNLAGQGITIKRYNALNGQCNLVIPNGCSGVWDAGSVYITPPAYNGASVGYGSNDEDTWFARWDASKMVGTNWQTGVVWNVTRPAHTLSVFNIWDGIAVFGFQSERQVAYNITNGDIIWNFPRENAYAAKVAGNGLYVNYYAEDMSYHAIDIYTGASVWNTSSADYPWGSFVPYTPVIAYDDLYTLSYDGHIYAYKTSDGTLDWKYYSGSTTETPYGNWAFWWGPIVADGKVYAGEGEHSPTQPLTRGNRLTCVDASTGEQEWSLLGMFKPYAIAEGYFLAVNVYDGYLYCFGKGQTTTTVAASPDVTSKGCAVLISGTVTDQSSSQAGVAAVSDDSITGQMENLLMQQPVPTNTTGVQVILTAVASDGTMIPIGTVTSDAGGLYKTTWQPSTEGVYTIVAQFDGTKSYWASAAETALAVVSSTGSPSVSSVPSSPSVSGESPSVSPPTEGPSTSVYIAVAAVVVIIAVIAAALVLRRRK
jgi:outer membrane protein assembly factor BamB